MVGDFMRRRKREHSLLRIACDIPRRQSIRSCCRRETESREKREDKCGELHVGLSIYGRGARIRYMS